GSAGPESGHALSRPPPARAPPLDQVPVGRLREQPQGQVLRADRARAPTDSGGDEELGDHGGGDGEVPRENGGPVIWPRIVDVFRRRRLDADLDSQLAYHRDALEAEARARGLSPDDARAAARRAMGGVTQAREAYRDQLTIPFIDALWQDVRYAIRAMRHN